MSCNSVSITGNLTRDGELRHTGKTAVLNLTLAVDERRKDTDGNWKNFPVFVDCVLFGNRAMAVADAFRKGLKISIKGRLALNQWEQDGQKRSKLFVVVEDFSYMSHPVQDVEAVAV